MNIDDELKKALDNEMKKLAVTYLLSWGYCLTCGGYFGTYSGRGDVPDYIMKQRKAHANLHKI